MAFATMMSEAASHISRNVVISWKKTRNTFHGCSGNSQRKSSRMSGKRSKSVLKICIRRKLVASLQRRDLSYSAQHRCLLLRDKCFYGLRFVVRMSVRGVSNKRAWSHSIGETLRHARNSIPIPFKLAFANTAIKVSEAKQKSLQNQRLVYYSFSDVKGSSASPEYDYEGSRNTYQKAGEDGFIAVAGLGSFQKGKKVTTSSQKAPPTSKTDTVSKSIEVARSQYEHLATSLTPQAEAEKLDENALFSSVRWIVETPVNSFFSFLSRTTARQKSSLSNNKHGVTQAADGEDKSDLSKKNVDAEKVKPPPSLLEMLYQYIPYVGSKEDTTKLKQAELEQKEELRIQAEKYELSQKVSINNRTRYLLQAIREANNLSSITRQVEDLAEHLLRFPNTRITAVKEDAIKEIMYLYRTTYNQNLIPILRMTLAMLGAVDPPKQNGIRVLAIDGGGSRGLAAVEILRRITELSGQPIHKMFDYICGVSTGAILGFLVGIKKVPICELGQLYRSLSSEIFKQNRLLGTGTLVFSHAYYNTETYQKLLKDVFGNELLIETAAQEEVPKCSAVSTLVNRLVLKPYMWRNYSIVPGTRITQWNGTCRATMWEAIRASSAAPGYFEEYKRDRNIHQDGGVLTNNPTGVALHECRLLWPNSPIQCVVSVGTGRYEPTVGPMGEDFLSLKDKLLKFVDSATSVSEVHTVIHDLLPPRTYFRFNPFIQEPLLLDECRSEKLDLLVGNACEYIEKNDYKFKTCVDTLLDRKILGMRNIGLT
ncbi:calcium-independent phospholipase A2-gamma-like [Clavelina lepadiformis]|uniref:calcium-independent phospholipase A2-gamma-like n=1 Tax=Clavelina lepadiformis TaxID=159417 RepID=UPI004041D7C5